MEAWREEGPETERVAGAEVGVMGLVDAVAKGQSADGVVLLLVRRDEVVTSDWLSFFC